MSYPPVVPVNVASGLDRPARDGEVQVDHDWYPALLALLQSHSEREGVALADYKRLATKSTDDGIRYLMRLILADERRHHEQMEQMINTIQSFAWDVKVEPRVPSLPAQKDPTLLEDTRLLLEFEKEDSKHLRELRKHLKMASKTSLLPLLTELMMHDSAKHVAILQYIRDQTSK
jgi:hypothetical protein